MGSKRATVKGTFVASVVINDEGKSVEPVVRERVSTQEKKEAKKVRHMVGGTPANDPVIPGLFLEFPVISGAEITRMVLSLPVFREAKAEDIKGHVGVFYMSLREYLKTMTNGRNPSNNEEASTKISNHNRRESHKTDSKRVKYLMKNFCVALMGDVYLSFNNGLWYTIINPNHRSEAARQLYLLGRFSEDELDFVIKVIVVPSQYATDIKLLIDNQTSIGGSDYVRNFDFIGGCYNKHIRMAMEKNFPLTNSDMKRFRISTFCMQFNRIAQFLTNFGEVKDISFPTIHAYRSKLDKAGKERATPGAGSLQETVLREIVVATIQYFKLRKLVAELAGEKAECFKKGANVGSFMGMYVCAVISGDALGKCRLERVAQNIVKHSDKFVLYVSRGTNHGVGPVRKNYEKLVSLLTQP